MVASERMAEAAGIAELIGLDFKAAVKAAAAEIPEPKAWAKLNADGTPKKAPAAKKKAGKEQYGNVIEPKSYDALMKMAKIDLQTLCVRNGLPDTGKKADLAERLRGVVPNKEAAE